MELEGKVVVVTGGASGIGRAMARRFHAGGARAVVVADRAKDGAEAVAAELEAARPGSALGVVADVSREPDVLALISATEAAFGPIDLFCANAGVGVGTDLESADEDWRTSMDVNFYAHLYAARALVPGWLERGEGYFLATASAAGLLTQIGSVTYAVSKHAAVAFAEWLSVTYGDRGLRVSCLCPMGVNTPLLNAPSQDGMANVGSNVVKAAGEVLEPEQVADIVAKGIAEERFLILPHAEVLTFLQRKTSDYDRWLAGMRRLQGARHRRVKAFAAAAGLFVLLTVGALATAPPAAAKSFAITSVATSARVQPDATMDVAEEVTYDFEGGPFTVGIRSFEGGSLSQITDFAVTDESGNALATTPPEQSISGEWEWSFAPTSDASRTFTVTYRVVDAAAVGPDVGELYWKFLGTDHPGVGNMTVQVDLPGSYPPATPTTPPTDTSVVRAWAHGPSNGRLVNNGSSVDLSVSDVPAERFVEARIAVPAAAFTVPPTGGPRLPTILEQEQRFIDDRETKDQRVRVGNIGAPIVAVLGAGGFFLVWRKWGKEPKPPATVGDYWREPLTDPPAVVVTNLAFGTVGGAAFPSTVVDLAQRGHLTITEEHVERLGPDKVVYHFAFKGNPKDGLSPYEEELLDTLFRGHSATTSEELMAWAKANHVDAEHFLHDWNEHVRREVASRGYLERGRFAKWIWWIVIALVLGIVGVVAVALGAWVGLVSIGAAVAVLAFGSTLRRRTEKGAERAAEAEALKRFLKDFSTLDEAPVESLAIWERYLVYAVALGVANDLIRGMALKVPQIASSPTFAQWYLVSGATGRLDSIGRFNSQFGATTVAAMTPSSTGSGGGFSGGGGGGGGGGGFGAR